jgi:hypothetical protein
VGEPVLHLLGGFVASECARFYILAAATFTESRFMSVDDLRAAGKFRVNQMCPLGRGQAKWCVHSF